MAPQKNGKKVMPYRHTKTELRIRLVWLTLKAMFECLYQYWKYIWDHNPLRVLTRRHRRLYFVENYGEIMIKPKFRERVLDLFLSDYRRRQRLLNWVHNRIGSHTNVHDFSTCWQDGTALCALLESICPGVCPSYHLLSGHNRVKNCRLGLKLANKYLYVPMDLISAEELAIANKATEHKIIQYISMVKWASQNIKEKWTTLHESLIAAKTGRCFAKGSGLKSGIVDKRSKFTVLVSDTIGVFNLLIEVRGPTHEYCGERIVSLHQAKALLDKSFDFDLAQSDNIKYLEDCAGNTFVRKKVPERYESGTSEPIFFDVQCGEEGTFYVTFVPRTAGMHAVAVKWQNHHVENSPFRIKVYKASNVSTKNLKGAQEKRVIYDSLSFSSQSADCAEHPDCVDELIAHTGHESTRSLSAAAKAKAYSKGRQLTVTRRRILRRIITRNGEDIVIEEAISPSLSRQSSITDNSDEDNRHQRHEKDEACTADQQVLKSHITVLGTVPEERRGSKESENENPSQVPKYKYTELDEHNRLDDVGYQTTSNDDGNLQSSEVTNEHAPNSEITLFEKHADDTAVVAKRSILKRTSSLHHPYKPPAKRTTSDGPVYKLRRGLVSFASGDMSDAGSDLSSEEKPNISSAENDTGTTSPVIRLLHSSSMKKACMYISEKAVHQSTVSSSGDLEPVIEDFTIASLPAKTKLRASQSLPIMRKYWKRDLTSEDSVKGLIYRLQKINSLTNLDQRYTSISDSFDIDNFRNSPKTTDQSHSVPDTKTETVAVEKEQQNSSVESVNKLSNLETQNGKFCTLGINDLKTDKCSSMSLVSVHGNSLESAGEKNEEKVTENQIPDIPSALNQRGNLTRQTTVFCQKSSIDSSSVKTDHSSDEKASTDQSSESKSNNFCAFRRIYIHPTEENKSVGKKEITLIIPKAKIDKCTQVAHIDIIRETGWDLIEGVYLLLRKISINLPCQINNVANNGTVPVARHVDDNHVGADDCENSREDLSSDKNRLQVPFSPRDDRDYPPRRLFTGTRSRALDSLGLPNQPELRNEYQRNVNAWFERNRLLNSPNRLAPVRQFTMETVDSGYDDCNTLSNYSRQGRHSLPNVLSDNGHIRLYRRPFIGRQIPLSPSLVNSNSTLSVSLERREKGNEADDELPLPDFSLTMNKPIRRRHKRINREDSFSLSDSELNERRKRMQRRNLTFDQTVSKNNEDDEDRKDFIKKMKEILTKKSVLGRLQPRKSPEQSSNSSECDLMYANRSEVNDRCTRPNQSTKALRNSLGTLTSVDSNYCGFGVSKSMRGDFLSQINSFKNLCPTEETQDDLSQDVKITHWQDEHVIIPYNDDNAGSHEENDVCSDVFVQSDNENGMYKSHETDDHVTDAESDNNESRKNSFESKVSVHSTTHGTIRSSTYFDMFSSFDHSLLHDNVEPSDIAMLGDVISLATKSGQQTIFRVAGAGLRYGTVGVNNAFQVWVENPSPGSLTVNISGPHSHSVTETSVIYTGDNLYEVSYEVAHPGKYQIFVRWGDRPLSKEPYVCEVTL